MRASAAAAGFGSDAAVVKTGHRLAQFDRVSRMAAFAVTPKLAQFDQVSRMAGFVVSPKLAAVDAAMKLAGLRLADYEQVGRAAFRRSATAGVRAGAHVDARLTPSIPHLSLTIPNSGASSQFTVIRRPELQSCADASLGALWSPRARQMRRQAFAGTFMVLMMGWTWQGVLESERLATVSGTSGLMPAAVAYAMYRLALWLFDQLFPA